MKKIIIILSLILLYNCGYSPIYNNTATNNIKLNIINMVGDNEFNNQIKNYAKLYSNVESKNEYDINIVSNYQKIILTKNSSGVATDYKIIVTVNFIINSNDQNQDIEFQENIKMENNSDTFKQEDYEKSLKRNFANSITKKLIIKLLRNSDI